ncbi:MAG: hypothetical protein ABR573_04125 [Candidatus Dormibacteria bacterium]
MHLAHVFIGKFDLQVPLSLVLVAAVAVVAVSFGLIYILPEREPRDERPGPRVPRAVLLLLQGFGLLVVFFLAVVGLFGRQQSPALNAATIAFWVVTIPLLPIAHCVLGGVYEVTNPFALGARLVTSGASARRGPHPTLARVGYWPAVVLLLVLFWFELAVRVVPDSPRALGVLVVVYAVFQVSMGAWLGEAWFARGDVFQVLTTLASTIAPAALYRDGTGYVRLRVGFAPDRPVAAARGQQALITLWLAGVLADGVKQTPIWKAISAAAPSSDSVSVSRGFDPRDFTLDTSEILFTWLAFALFFWAFTWLAATASRKSPRELASVVSPSLIPIALAYLLAHNLTQLLIVTPIMWTASSADATAMRFQVEENIRHVTPAVIFLVQVTAIVIGHVVAVVMAHARLRAVEKNPGSAIRADLGWLAAMLIYTATSLWVIAQPIANAD